MTHADRKTTRTGEAPNDRAVRRYISFSGGLTSGLMLRRELDRGFDGLVIFANTGKERVETLEFVAEVGRRWGVSIHWIEYAEPEGYREVSFETASRAGEPFAARIRANGYLPHPGAPWCSSEVKFRPVRAYLEALGWDDWESLIGLRADERPRVAKIRGRKIDGGRVECPLYDDGIHLGDVEAFWASQPFTLQLHPHEGNCDLCWKKGGDKLKGLIDQRPDRTDWWAEQERLTGTRWRDDRATYTALGKMARAQVRLPLFDDGGEPCSVCA